MVSYTVYRAAPGASGQYERDHIPDLKNTDMTTEVGPFDSWSDPSKIISLDP